MIDVCPDCESKHIILVEYDYSSPKHYDGISEIECKNCGKRFGRWCKEELFMGETENLYCKGESHS